jgi:hypothetical protein
MKISQYLLLLVFIVQCHCVCAQTDMDKAFLMLKGTWKYPVDNTLPVETDMQTVFPNAMSFVSDSSYDVHSVAEGEVVCVTKYDDIFMVVVKQGNYFIGYSNLSKVGVKKYDLLESGQTIGNMGLDLDDKYRLDVQLTNRNTDMDISSWFAKNTCIHFL